MSIVVSQNKTGSLSNLETLQQCVSQADLSLILTALTRYGSPRLGVYGSEGKWHCSVEMHVSSAGATFKVASEYSMDTPLLAALQCAERIIETLKKYE